MRSFSQRCALGHTRCSGSRTVEVAGRHPVRFATASVGDLTRIDTTITRITADPRPARERSSRTNTGGWRKQNQNDAMTWGRFVTGGFASNYARHLRSSTARGTGAGSSQLRACRRCALPRVDARTGGRSRVDPDIECERIVVARRVCAVALATTLDVRRHPRDNARQQSGDRVAGLRRRSPQHRRRQREGCRRRSG